MLGIHGGPGHAGRRRVRVEVATGLGPWAATWDALVDTLATPSPFLRSWWVEEAVGGPRRLVLVHHDGALVGGLACEVRVRPGGWGPQRWVLAGQGALCPDLLDLVVRPGWEPEVTAAVAAGLGRAGVGVLDLDGVVEGGSLAAVLGRRARWGPAEVIAFADLRAGADAYLAGLPGELRSTLRRAGRRLDRAGAVHRVWPAPADVTTPLDARARAEVVAALERLRDLHRHRWEAASGFLPVWDRFAAAARRGAEAGDVAVHELVVGDVVAASEVVLRAGTRWCFYQSGRIPGREWRSVGSVLRARVIRHVVGLGATEYDLLRGDESYKAAWATHERTQRRVLAGTGVRGQVVVAVERGVARARQAAAATARRAGRRPGRGG